MGWLTVLAYFVSCWLSFKVYRQGDQIFHRIKNKQKFLWLAIAVATLCLGINKQLDLQTFFTASSKYIFIELGIYNNRRSFQELFIVIVAMGSLVICVGLFIEFYKVIANHWLAIGGLVFLLAFVVIRASSFHNVDMLLGARVIGLKLNWILELSGIALIIINAVKLLRRQELARQRYYRKCA